MTINNPLWMRSAAPTEILPLRSNPDPEPDADVSRQRLMIDHAAEWVAHRPWLAAVAIAGLAIWVAGHVVVSGWRHRHHANHAQLITIAPPPEVDPAGARAVWANLSGTLSPSWRRRFIYGTPHVAWEYQWTGRQFTISLWVPGSVPVAAVEAAIRGAWPGAATSRQPATPPVPVNAPVVAGGQLLPAYADWLPFATDHDTDPLRAVVAAGTRPARPRARLRADPGPPGPPTPCPTRPPGGNPASRWPHRDTTPRSGRAAAVARRRPPHPQQPRDQRAAGSGVARRWSAISAPSWRRPRIRCGRPVSATSLSTAAPVPGRRRGSVPPRTRSPPRSPSTPDATGSPTGSGSATPPPPSRPGASAAGFLTSTPELAALAGLPQDLTVPGLERARAKAVAPPVAVPAGGRNTKVLGTAQLGGHTVALPVADARYHLHVLGATGSGKTTLLADMIIQDINARRGTVVIDPHGDLVLDVLDRLPATVGDRLVLFDPDQPNPPVLNPLDGDDHQLLVDNIVAIMSSIFVKAWGPRMDDVMRVACLTLLRHANVTLQHIPPLLNSPQFRAAMTADLDDPEGLSGFWQWYDEMTPALRSQVIGPVLARLRSFLLRDFVKQSMGHPKSSFDMAKVLDGGVLLARLPKGALGEETSRLMGSLILAKVWQTASARATTPADRRRDAAIYLDEAQNFLTLAASLDTMLAEARKYRLSMVLSHQNLAQFPRDLLAAVSANARNKLYFACSPEDAHQLARHTMPDLDEHDLTHLDAYTAATRLVISGRQTPAFTLTTRPPRPIVGEATALRQHVAQRQPPQDTSAIEHLAGTRSNVTEQPRQDIADHRYKRCQQARQGHPAGASPLG